jgi:hypothetical protein
MTIPNVRKQDMIYLILYFLTFETTDLFDYVCLILVNLLHRFYNKLDQACKSQNTFIVLSSSVLFCFVQTSTVAIFVVCMTFTVQLATLYCATVPVIGWLWLNCNLSIRQNHQTTMTRYCWCVPSSFQC